MKVLFLDVDGVLNSSDWFRRRDASIRGVPNKTLPQMAKFQLDDVAIGRLNQVLERTGAVVVMSSTWRLGDEKKWADTKKMLRLRGFKGEIIGRTPDLARWNVGSGIALATQRGTEIQTWLDVATKDACLQQPAFRDPVEQFAIVDDGNDMAHLMDRLVKTKFETGLLDEHVERLVEMLS